MAKKYDPEKSQINCQLYGGVMIEIECKKCGHWVADVHKLIVDGVAWGECSLCKCTCLASHVCPPALVQLRKRAAEATEAHQARMRAEKIAAIAIDAQNAWQEQTKTAIALNAELEKRLEASNAQLIQAVALLDRAEKGC